VALRFVQHGQVGAVKEGALEQLHADAREHEDEQERDDENVFDGFESNDQAVDDMLEALGSVNGAQWTQHSKNTQYFEHGQHLGFVGFAVR